MSSPLSPLTPSHQNSRTLSQGSDDLVGGDFSIDEIVKPEYDSENAFRCPKKIVDDSNTNTPSGVRHAAVHQLRDQDFNNEEPDFTQHHTSSPFRYDGRDDTVDLKMLRTQVSLGSSQHSMTPRKRSYEQIPEDQDKCEELDDRSKKGMTKRDVPDIHVFADAESICISEPSLVEGAGQEVANSMMEERHNEGMSTVLHEKNDYDDDYAHNKENFNANDEMNDDTHDTLDDTCFSTFSAVPNADMTAFAKLRGDSPFKAMRHLSPAKASDARRGSVESSSPAISGRPYRASALIDVSSPVASPTPRRREFRDDGNSNDTSNLLDFTDQVSFTPRQRYSVQKERYSPSRRSPLRGFRESLRSPSKMPLLDFDIPSLPTPRSLPSITPRELESLKSGFLSEISSLKATLSGKEAEVASLKQAVADAERRVGEALEEVRNEVARKETLEAEWRGRAQEMESVLRSVKAEIVEGGREKQRWMERAEEAEISKEQIESRMVELESQLSAARKSASTEGSSEGARHTKTAEETANEVQDAVEKVARELHTLYKSKHETKVAALKKSYEARWEKRVREAENKLRIVNEENERLKIERDNALSEVPQFDTSMMARQNDEQEAEKRVLEAQINGLQHEMAVLKEDSERLRSELKVERAEKGELVAAVDEWLAIQQNQPQPQSSSESSRPRENESPEPMSAVAERRSDELRRSVSQSSTSGIRPPSTGSANGEKRISKIGAPATRHARGNSGGKSGIAVFTPGRNAGGIMGSIERMGRGV